MVFGTQLDVHAGQVQVEAPDMSHNQEKRGSYTEFLQPSEQSQVLITTNAGTEGVPYRHRTGNT